MYYVASMVCAGAYLDAAGEAVVESVRLDKRVEVLRTESVFLCECM
tara:strand:- start:2168 stop:2305 length:138 start_codon:yes stop_codon:yes gene_type:complete